LSDKGGRGEKKMAHGAWCSFRKQKEKGEKSRKLVITNVKAHKKKGRELL